MTKYTSRISDGPALDPRVRRLLAAAAARVETTGPLPGEDEALAAFRISPQGPRRNSMLSPLVSVKTAVASAIGAGVLVTGGLGAAAAGVLPGPAQQTASSVLETVGISVPAGGQGADNNGRPEQTPGDAADQTTGEGADQNADVPPAADHGKQVSDTAKNTTGDGADKGKEIAGVASDGRVQSGNGDSAGDHNSAPPVPAPNTGGTGAASDATDGHDQSAGAAADGTTTAGESSGGASTAGSSNAPDHN